MKNFRQLVKELPSSTVVVTTGSFNPPTAKNELQFKLVEKLVEKHRAQHIIYIKEEGLPTARKTHFLNLMFSPFNYVPLKGSLNEEVARLKTKYKNVIVVGDSVKGKLAESVQVIPFDEVESKIKGMVTKGDYTSFKAQMPSSMRDIDAKRLMNEMRQSYGLEFLKEDVKFSIDALRDKYFKGEIYQIGDIVESAGQEFEIMDRGSNYLVLVDNKGDLSRKWVKDVSLVEAKAKKLAKACWKGYKAIGLKNKNGRQVPNCVPEQVNEQHTKIDHNDDHKVISHGHDFSFKIHKDHHEKLKNLQHNEQHTFKCMDGIEYGARKVGDKLHFQQHPGDSGIHGNLSIHVPHDEFNKDDKEVSYKGYTTKNLHFDPSAAHAFKMDDVEVTDPVAMLNAIKTTDAYMELHHHYGDNPSLDQVKSWKHAHIKAKEALQKLGKFDLHKESWLNHEYVLDEMLKPHAAAIREGLTLDKHSNYNIAKGVMSYQDFMKLNKMNTGFVKDTKQHPFNHRIEPNVSQQIDDLQQWPFEPQTAVGHTLATRPHLRRQKVMYATESVQGDLMDEDFAAQFVAEGEVGDEKIVHVKTLPPELAPKKKDADRLGGGTRDHTFSAFMEKQKKLQKTKENADYNGQDLIKHQQTGE